MSFTHFILSLLFPRRCLGCRQAGSYFCQSCITTIIYSTIVPIVICPLCVKPSVGGETHPYCKTKYQLDGFIAIFQYKGPIAKAVKLLKYQRVTDVTGELSSLLHKTLIDCTNRQFSFIRSFIQKEKPTIVPIPLHWFRQRKRWFNQAELVGRELAKLLTIQYGDTLLTRTKSVPPQAELQREKRLKNVKGIFSINPNFQFSNSNASFLLFDDVWTTGSTVREAASVLKRAGAKTVWALTIAR